MVSNRSRWFWRWLVYSVHLNITTIAAARIMDSDVFSMAYLVTVMRSVCETPIALVIRSR